MVVANAPADLKQRFAVVSASTDAGFTEAIHRWLNDPGVAQTK